MKIWNPKVIIANTLMALLLTSLVTVMGGGSSPAAAATSEDDDEVSTSSDGLSAASGSKRFVVWQDSTPGNLDIFFRRSTDSGATWKSIKNLSGNPGDSYSPQIAVSGSNVYVIWTQFSSDGKLADVFFRGSTDNGVTWGSKINISNSGTNSNFGSAHIATSGSNVYISWEEHGASDIFFRRSTDEGSSWKAIENLSNNAGNSRDPQLAASGSNVLVVWFDETPGNYEILLTRSTDGGATWKSSVNISNNTGDSAGPQIAVSGSNVYVAWMDFEPGAPDIFFSRSTDNGATWSPSVNLSTNPKHSGGQLIAVSGSNVYVLWGQRISSDGSEIYLRRSTNNGATWEHAVKISNSGTETSVISHDIAVSGSNVYITWADDVSTDAYFRRSTDGGASWKARINISNSTGASENTQIAVLGSNVYIVWNDQTFGNRDIMLKRSTNSGSTWKAVKNLSNNDGVSELPQIGA